jgi:F-box and leucine-rich repeat protein GRR1
MHPPASQTRRKPTDSRSSSGSSSPVLVEHDESDFFGAGNESESSAGVPNFQDMRVDDDACLPPVHRLPNEILISIFSRLSSLADLLHVMLTCKRWSRNAVDLLWHRPACSNWEKHEKICRTLSNPNTYFDYRHFVKRINLAALADKLNDGSVMPLAECNRVERLTLTGCSKLTDTGLVALINNSHHLYSLDVSVTTPLNERTLADHITDVSINALADNCPHLQGLNISGCQRISNESLIRLAQRCRHIRRVSLCFLVPSGQTALC